MKKAETKNKAKDLQLHITKIADNPSEYDLTEEEVAVMFPHLLQAVRAAMIETGRMAQNDRIECVETSQDGAWVRVGCYLNRGLRTKKPHMYWNFCVNIPENRIHWDATTWYCF